MFAFEFEKSLFAFDAERPQIDPLFALPPTYSNLTKSTFLYFAILIYDSPFSDFPRGVALQRRYELRAPNFFGLAIESQTSAEVRIRVREGEIRGRRRKTAKRPAIRSAADGQQPSISTYPVAIA